MWKDEIKLGSGNSLILGNSPKILSLEQVATAYQEQQKEIDVQSFGLFDVAAPNYTTYYPDVKAEELTPKDEEFIFPVFRSLSQVVVHKNFNPVDFGRGNVLKNSMGLMKGQTVNADHETAIGNAMGAVQDVFWENAYKAKNGIQVPAGFNSRFKLDGKGNPRIARQIMMDPPGIHSTSVTVQFIWDKSHVSMDDKEFFSKLGQKDKDGKLITRVAAKVLRYHEISLVSHGADPYAQKIKNDGEINNPLFADISYNREHKGARATKYFMFDYKQDIIENSTTPEEDINNNQPQQESMNKEFLIALCAIMGITQPADDAALTEDFIQSSLGEIVTARNTATKAVTDNAAELTRLQGIETAYNAEKATMAESVTLKAFKDTATSELRSKVTKNYNLVAGTKPVEAITKLIANASFDTLTALDAQYTQLADEKFPTTCAKCGSHEVSRASAKQGDKEGDETGGKVDFMKNILSKKSGTKIINGITVDKEA